MSYRKKTDMYGPTYEQEIELRIKEAYSRAGYTTRGKKRIKPLEFRLIIAPTPEQIHEMRYAMNAWAIEGAANLQAEAALRGEDPEYVFMDAQRQAAKELDKLREKDPAKAAVQVAFVRQMFKAHGKPPPYPFN